MEQKTYPKEGHKGNFLTNSPKRGRVKETTMVEKTTRVEKEN